MQRVIEDHVKRGKNEEMERRLAAIEQRLTEIAQALGAIDTCLARISALAETRNILRV
jgi:hypothetical protein